MDKSEYKLRAEEIKDLISRGEYAQAAEIADTIDWRRVKSVMMLCTISDLYKIIQVVILLVIVLVYPTVCLYLLQRK